MGKVDLRLFGMFNKAILPFFFSQNFVSNRIFSHSNLPRTSDLVSDQEAKDALDYVDEKLEQVYFVLVIIFLSGEFRRKNYVLTEF